MVQNGYYTDLKIINFPIFSPAQITKHFCFKIQFETKDVKERRK